MNALGVFIGTVAVSVLCGCASTPVAVGPVGPNPVSFKTHSDHGQLEVYSALVGRSEGNNPAWFQHANYTLYDQKGKRVRQINNALGRYASRPATVSLPPGRYLVKTESSGYFRVKVPVAIVAGQTTRVHLDGQWHPTMASAARVVTLPGGSPVGWLAGAK